MDTSTYHNKSRRREQVGIEARIREICETRVRYVYRRVNVLHRREDRLCGLFAKIHAFSHSPPTRERQEGHHRGIAQT